MLKCIKFTELLQADSYVGSEQLETAADHSGKGVWPIAMVNKKISVAKSYFHDPDADDLQKVNVIFLVQRYVFC